MSARDDQQLGTEPEAVPTWQPETPFLPDLAALRPAPLSPARAFGPARELESPFTSEYALEGGAQPVPGAERYARLLGELYDSELEEALTDLVNEAASLAEDRFARETGDPARERQDAERAVAEFLEPLEREATAMLERLADAAGERDAGSMTEAEVEALFERVQPGGAMPSPVFEDFLKKLWNKAKKAVKSVAKVVGKVLPINAVLGKLKALVRPLLQRVLRFAIDKLPAAVRPAARQLASRFLGVKAEAEAEEPLSRRTQAAADPATIQEELDARLAASLLGGEDVEAELEDEDAREAAAFGPVDPLRELEEARDQFARDVAALRPGQDPTPAVEHFIPAILAAAKIAIGIIGRQRVVNFLASLVAKLISKFVGPEAATALSRALVDTGLRLVSLETAPEAERLAAGYTVASTVEDTVNRLVADAPAEAWESEGLLEAYTLEAFEKAAAGNFPDATIRPELRESAQAPGAWVLMPAQGRRKRYKKYTRVLEAQLTPQMAQWIRSFGGVRLATVLQDRYGVARDAPVQVRLHLYEAIRGTTLSHVALHEKGLPGLGTARRSSWTLLHPLTPCTAGLLFQEPGLGADVADRFLSDRNLVDVGQRFFFVEIPGVTPRPLAPAPGTGGRVACRDDASRTSLVLDFPRGQIRLYLFYSEADAQQLLGQLQKRSPGAIPALFAPGLDASLRAIFRGDAPKRLRVIHEAVPSQGFLAGAGATVLKMVGEKLAEWLVEWLLKALKAEVERGYERFVARFRAAVADKACGVTVAITFQGPAFLEKLRAALTSNPLAAVPGVLSVLGLKAAASAVTVELRPGSLVS